MSRSVAAIFALLMIGCRHDADPHAAAVTLTSAETADADAGSGETRSSKDGTEPPSTLPALPRAQGVPVVALDGASRPWPEPLRDDAPRVAAIAIEAPILAEPDTASPRVGLLRAGAIVEMDPRPIVGKSCAAGFRAIKPVGYVCLGSATTDLENPIVRASTRRPDTTEKLPYIYGMADRGGPAYGRIPTQDEMERLEPHLSGHFRKWARDPVNGARYGVDVWNKWKKDPPPDALEALNRHVTDEDIPPFLRNGGRPPNLSGLFMFATVKAGEFERHNGIAFLDSFLADGRRFNLSIDLRLMPADRFRPIRGSDFHGFRIPEDIAPPFAIVRGQKTKKYEERGSRLVAAGEMPWRAAVGVTGKKRVQDDRTFIELTGGGWVVEHELTPVEITKRMPGWANDGEKWLDVNVTQQVLVAYEGTRPVFATLVSTGEDGLDDPKTSRSTVRGAFRINSKHVTQTMDSKSVGEEFELRDVPYVQYFHEGYALHAAYWHDVFGMPKSHGCINLAPEDARRLFFWTEPQVPSGWHAASTAKNGTVVYVHH